MQVRGERDAAAVPVVVVGGGPVGLLLAAELALAGVTVEVLELRTDRTLAGSRAGGLHSRTIEELDQRGLAERFLAAGRPMQVAGFAGVPLDIGDLPTRHPYGLALWQDRVEGLLRDRVDELGVPVRHGREVTGLEQDRTGVELRLADGTALRARYVVGCDGGRSRIRSAAGIAFPGEEASVSTLIAEARFDGEPELGFRRDARGFRAMSPLEDGRIRVVVEERHTDPTREPTPDLLREVLVAGYGTDFGLRDAGWVSRFTDAVRQAAAYRAGRVLVAGDAAHVHGPTGGQGLNTGLQDATNLGWKLARVVLGHASDALLDSYHSERHPVGARVGRTVAAQSPLVYGHGAHLDALRATVADLLAGDVPRRRYGARMSGLDVAYDLGAGHPLLGRRMPDLDLAADGVRRVFSLLHDGRPLLLDLGGRGDVELGHWAGRVRLVRARAAERWDLPVLGTVDAPGAVLVRPDGYVAWTGDDARSGLTDALATWSGRPGEPPELG